MPRTAAHARAISASALTSSRHAASPTENSSGQRVPRASTLIARRRSSARRATISPRGLSAPGRMIEQHPLARLADAVETAQLPPQRCGHIGERLPTQLAAVLSRHLLEVLDREHQAAQLRAVAFGAAYLLLEALAQRGRPQALALLRRRPIGARMGVAGSHAFGGRVYAERCPFLYRYDGLCPARAEQASRGGAPAHGGPAAGARTGPDPSPCAGRPPEMLQELRVENLLLIEQAQLRLAPGLNVLTGETGAGKSMLANALDLLLGGRARPGIVRPGAGEAYVEGIFDLPERLREQLGERVSADAEEVVLARRVGSDGRTRAYLNGRSASVAELRDLGGALLAFYGQHEHRKLMLSGAQLAILDGRCAGDHAGRLRACAQAFAHTRALEERLHAVRELCAQRARELDLLAVRARRDRRPRPR